MMDEKNLLEKLSLAADIRVRGHVRQGVGGKTIVVKSYMRSPLRVMLDAIEANKTSDHASWIDEAQLRATIQKESGRAPTRVEMEQGRRIAAKNGMSIGHGDTGADLRKLQREVAARPPQSPEVQARLKADAEAHKADGENEGKVLPDGSKIVNGERVMPETAEARKARITAQHLKRLDEAVADPATVLDGVSRTRAGVAVRMELQATQDGVLDDRDFEMLAEDYGIPEEELRAEYDNFNKAYAARQKSLASQADAQMGSIEWDGEAAPTLDPAWPYGKHAAVTEEDEEDTGPAFDLDSVGRLVFEAGDPEMGKVVSVRSYGEGNGYLVSVFKYTDPDAMFPTSKEFQTEDAALRYAKSQAIKDADGTVRPNASQRASQRAAVAFATWKKMEAADPDSAEGIKEYVPRGGAPTGWSDETMATPEGMSGLIKNLRKWGMTKQADRLQALLDGNVALSSTPVSPFMDSLPEPDEAVALSAEDDSDVQRLVGMAQSLYGR